MASATWSCTEICRHGRGLLRGHQRQAMVTPRLVASSSHSRISRILRIEDETCYTILDDPTSKSVCLSLSPPSRVICHTQTRARLTWLSIREDYPTFTKSKLFFR
nr:hypothetical protein CFP56_11896 [Quercus suber]